MSIVGGDFPSRNQFPGSRTRPPGVPALGTPVTPQVKLEPPSAELTSSQSHRDLCERIGLTPGYQSWHEATGEMVVSSSSVHNYIAETRAFVQQALLGWFYFCARGSF